MRGQTGHVGCPALQAVHRLPRRRNHRGSGSLHPGLYRNCHRLAFIRAVAVGGRRHQIVGINGVVAVHIDRLLDLTAQRVVFVQRGASRRSHAAHQLLLRIVILRFGVAVRIGRLVLPPQHVGINRLVLRQRLLPVRAVLIALRMHRRAGNSGQRAVNRGRNLRAAIRPRHGFGIGHHIRRFRIGLRISGTVAERVLRGGQFAVDVFVRRSQFAAVPPLDRHRRLVAGGIVAVQRRDPVADRVAEPSGQVVIPVGGGHAVAVGFRLHAAAAVGAARRRTIQIAGRRGAPETVERGMHGFAGQRFRAVFHMIGPHALNPARGILHRNGFGAQHHRRRHRRRIRRAAPGGFRFRTGTVTLVFGQRYRAVRPLLQSHPSVERTGSIGHIIGFRHISSIAFVILRVCIRSRCDIAVAYRTASGSQHVIDFRLRIARDLNSIICDRVGRYRGQTTNLFRRRNEFTIGIVGITRTTAVRLGNRRQVAVCVIRIGGHRIADPAFNHLIFTIGKFLLRHFLLQERCGNRTKVTIFNPLRTGIATRHSFAFR